MSSKQLQKLLQLQRHRCQARLGLVLLQQQVSASGRQLELLLHSCQPALSRLRRPS
jgi:hypothetical protein